MDQSEIQTKAGEFVSKNSALLDEKKYYQFAQKVKLFGHRKFQSKKYDEAAAIFKAGANALYSISEVEKNIPLQLLDQLVDIYTAQPKNLTKKSQQQLLTILQKRPLTQRQLKLIHTIIIKTGKPSEHLTLANAFVNFNIEQGSFPVVERMAANLSSQTSWSFVQKWSESKEILPQQKPALWCRMVLYRGIEHGINEAQEMFKNVSEIESNKNPFLIFTGFLLKAVAINSKNAYEVLERSYSAFLQNDRIFSSLMDSYGSRFFGMDKKKGGLLSLIE